MVRNFLNYFTHCSGRRKLLKFSACCCLRILLSKRQRKTEKSIFYLTSTQRGLCPLAPVPPVPATLDAKM